MSGGSFNYLCDVWHDGLAERRSDLQAMAETIDTYPDGAVAAAATAEFLRGLDLLEASVQRHRDAGLNDVWRAVEWHQSSDWSVEQVAEVLAVYNDWVTLEAAVEEPVRDLAGDLGVQYESFVTQYQFQRPICFEGAPLDHAGEYDSFAITVEWRGGDRWAVCRGPGWRPGQVWCAGLQDWVYEPSPSERSGEFLSQTRYSKDEALRIGLDLARRAGHV